MRTINKKKSFEYIADPYAPFETSVCVRGCKPKFILIS